MAMRPVISVGPNELHVIQFDSIRLDAMVWTTYLPSFFYRNACVLNANENVALAKVYAASRYPAALREMR